MSQPCALFADLRSAVPSGPGSWPTGPDLTLAYIVTGTLEQTQDFFKEHHKALATIPHITCEITQPDVIHLLTRLPAVTRLSLPHDTIIKGLSDHFALDAIIQWDHRRSLSFYQEQVMAALHKGANHISLYGLQDFAVWQQIQTYLNEHGLVFYERFHAAKPGHESIYQNHLAQFGDVIAIHGWSRLSDAYHTRIRSPRQRDFTTLDRQSEREERLLLGLSNRYGVPLADMPMHGVQQATASGLGVMVGERFCPTDLGLWDTTRLVAQLL